MTPSDYQDLRAWWYTVNLQCHQHCLAWRAEIADLQAQRETAPAKLQEKFSSWGIVLLRRELSLYGTEAKSIAKTGNKMDLVACLVALQLSLLDERIAQLEKKIRDHAPDPTWREA